MHDITAVTCAKLQNVGFLLTNFYMLASLARALTTFWRSTITALPVICASFCHQSSFPPSLDQNFVAWCQNHFLSFCESFVVTSLIIFLQFANKQTKHPDSLTDFGAIWVFYLVTYLLTYLLTCDQNEYIIGYCHSKITNMSKFSHKQKVGSRQWLNGENAANYYYIERPSVCLINFSQTNHVILSISWLLNNC